MKHINLDLRKAKSEIKEIMDKYDCGGLVSLHNQTHTEFDLLMPAWSVAKIINNEIRIKHSKNDPIEQLESTVHLMADCSKVCSRINYTLDQLMKELTKHIQIETTPFKERD